jgi:hypothetical protein
MKLFSCVVMIALASIPVVGQTRDRNLAKPRIRGDVSTVSPTRAPSNSAQTKAQLDRLEQQTARAVTPPPAKKATPLPKLRQEPQPHPTASQDAVPPRAKPNSGATSSRYSGRSGTGHNAAPHPR